MLKFIAKNHYFSQLPLKKTSNKIFYFIQTNSFSEGSYNKKSQTKDQDSSDKSKFEQFTDSFFEILKREKGTLNEGPINYNYSSRVIYSNNIDPKLLLSNTRTRLIMTFLWTFLGYASFVYIHPLVTLIPAWFGSGNFLAFILAKNYANKLVCQVLISEDQKYVEMKVSKLKSKPIRAKIEDMDLYDIMELKEKTTNKDPNQHKKLSNSFVAIFDVNDEKGSSFHELRLFIEPKNINIENMDLFKYVLNGNQTEVDKFRFLEEQERIKEIEKENHEIDKKIEEEFERIKQEAEPEEKAKKQL